VHLINVWCPRLKSLEAIVHTSLCILLARVKSADIIHIHAIGPALLAPLARLLGLKVVMTHHGFDYERKKWNGVAKAALRAGEMFGVLFSHRVIVISNNIKETLQQKYPHKRFDVIPNGVTQHKILPRGDAILKYGIGRKKYIFTACRFVPEKGLHDLIKAYGAIGKKDFLLVIAGGEDHPSEYGTLIRSLAEQHGAILTGKIFGQELDELYSNAALFVLPSSHEGFPISLLEALSYGVPVLVSDIAANLEIPLRDARHFETGNVQDLKDHIAQLIDEKIDTQEIEGLKKLVEKSHNWERIAQKNVVVYDEIQAS